ncbi:MAG: hypothetical protein JKX94_02770 [Sneathiella sp.]|nr:hypothetical protein [Sneathiella sp.]
MTKNKLDDDMLNKEMNNLGVMGFVTFEKLPDVNSEDVIAASLRWQREFLKPMEGMGFHCLLGNLNGGFADLIFGTDRSAFERMNELFPSAPSSAAMMKLLDRESISMRSAELLKKDFSIPVSFSCVEAGFMRAVKPGQLMPEDVVHASETLERDYLEAYANTQGHFVGTTEENSYCEVTFGQTLGQTREICFGYEAAKPCSDFLDLFDKPSFEFDFWFPLA